MVSLATDQSPLATVVIDGSIYDAESFTTSHGVDQGVGTATVVIPLAQYSLANLGNAMNKRVEIRAGYNGITAPAFVGRITDSEVTFDDDGNTAQVKARGWLSMLDREVENDIVSGSGFTNTDPKAFLNGIFFGYGVPTYFVDSMAYMDPAVHPTLPISMYWGGQPEVDGGSVIIPKGTNLLSWWRQKLALWGYRIFDTPSGTVRVQRINGLPPTGDPLVATYSEGVDLFNERQTQTNREIINWWRVNGARYTSASTGGLIQVTSIPASTPNNPDIGGYRVGQLTDTLITNNSLATGVRISRELDYAERTIIETYDIAANTNLQPGNKIVVLNPSVDASLSVDSSRWLMAINRSFSADGFTDTIDTWRGMGNALPSGNDCISVSLASGGTLHIGDKTLDNYRVQAPNGVSATLSFTVPNAYSTLNFRCYCHGVNWNQIRGGNDPASLSLVEVWQGEAKKGTAYFPELADDPYASYADGVTGWTFIAIPLPGSLVAGSAEIRIISGTYNADIDQPRDDFEVRGMTVQACGQGAP